MPPTRGAEVGDAGPTMAFMRADYRSLLRQFARMGSECLPPSFRNHSGFPMLSGSRDAVMEVEMERRQFLMSALGLAGAAVVVSAMRPAQAFAGVPGPGILDELDQAQPAVLDGDAEATVEQVDHRHWHRRHWDRPRWEDRGWRRHHWRDGPRGRWRRVCRRVWRRGEWRVRCWRERVWRGGW